jgi:TetR/AcrR family transcriptional repressor of mexJK operon
MLKTDETQQPVFSARGQLILTAAQQLFFQHGFDETSLEMIINEAGGSRRSIYNEFGNKQGLLLAVIQKQVCLQAQTLTAINRALSPAEALNDVCCKFVQGMLSVTLRSLFRLVVQQAVKLPEVGEIIYQKGPMTAVLPLVDYLNHLVEENILQIEDSLFSAQMLLEMAKGPLYTRTLLLPHKDVSDEEIKQQVHRVVEIFLKAHQR